uniref:Uncharacterized protein n=1 Tax=Lepeophtheirus salmonis TaxID=72036 RepID=A0A0K2VBY8_LEPSM
MGFREKRFQLTKNNIKLLETRIPQKIIKLGKHWLRAVFGNLWHACHCWHAEAYSLEHAN